MQIMLTCPFPMCAKTKHFINKSLSCTVVLPPFVLPLLCVIIEGPLLLFSEMDVESRGSSGGEQAESSVSRASRAAVASLNNGAIYWVEYATQCVQGVWVTEKIFHINWKM